MDDETPTFTATDWYTRGGHTMASVYLDRETHDFAHLRGKRVIVDGKAYMCRGIERFAHGAPWRAGEGVGLALEPVDAK